jgi:hypothetical protein
MGLKDACPSPDSSCQIVCKSPDSSNSCTKLSARLVDGSPCGQFLSLAFCPFVKRGCSSLDPNSQVMVVIAPKANA